MSTATPVKPRSNKSNGNASGTTTPRTSAKGKRDEQLQDLQAQVNAISRSQAVIEFEMDGTIISANDNFLNTLGYQLDEIQGQHHRLFVDEASASSPEYRQFWADLRAGQFKAGEFKRIGKCGNEIWIQASYNPVFDDEGNPLKVVKFATDITVAKGEAEENARTFAMVENMTASITFADTNNIISYVNPAAIKLLRKVEHLLPVKVEEITGQSVDIFHKRPQHQRDLLADPKNFPYEGTIPVGPESFSLKASRILDTNGDFAGTLVTWECVTEKLANEKLANEKAVKENVERERAQAEELRNKVDSLLAVVNAAAAGDLTQDVTVTGDDAMGQMADGLKTLLTDLRGSMTSISENAQTLSTASSELSAVSIEMRSNADNTSNQANVVSTASEGVSENVQSVSASIEEMNASIREISRSATDAANIAGNAVTAAESTNEIVSRLGVSSAEIGKVVKVINSIAEQTNLLALNATIEAARAGEAGKGFAVVANEVKELAKETAKATEDISQRIDAIQTDTGGAVTAITEITKVIGQINEASTTIASAVEEQSATTVEIGRSISEASTGTNQIVENVTEVAKAAENTMQGAGSSQEAAEELARMATALQDLVAKFTV